MIDMHLKIWLSDAETKSFVRSAVDCGYKPDQIVKMLILQYLQREQDMRDADDAIVLKAFKKTTQGE